MNNYQKIYALTGIGLSVVIRISSIFTPSTAANTTRLSMVGNAVPCCHLYSACGVEKPKISCSCRTDNPACTRNSVMCCPVFTISIVGIVTIFISSCSGFHQSRRIFSNALVRCLKIINWFHNINNVHGLPNNINNIRKRFICHWRFIKCRFIDRSCIDTLHHFAVIFHG